MDEWPQGVGRKYYPELGSTNSEAVRLARTCESGPLWIQAGVQTSGRGRRGREWHGGAGNFSATLLMRPDGTPDKAAQRSFIAALALHEALVGVSGREDLFSLKWPNDVLGAGRKLAGILLESGPGYLCVGIGVNLVNAPEADQIEKRAVAPVSLFELTGTAPDPQAFLTSLATAFARFEAQFTAYGFAPIREAWLARAARLGETITARLPDRDITGVFKTIDETGAIVLKTAKGRTVLPAADIFFEG